MSAWNKKKIAVEKYITSLHLLSKGTQESSQIKKFLWIDPEYPKYFVGSLTKLN